MIHEPAGIDDRSVTDPLEEAMGAHADALGAQAAMREAAHRRDKAVLSARRAGVFAAELAVALGVNRHRIHAMLKSAEAYSRSPDNPHAG